MFSLTEERKETLFLGLQVFTVIFLLACFAGYIWKGFEYFEIGCAIERIRMFFEAEGKISWPVSASDKVFIFLWVPAFCCSVFNCLCRLVIKPLAVVTAIMMVYFSATRQDPFYIMFAIVMLPVAMSM